MSRPIKSAAQVQKDEAMVETDELRGVWHLAVADSNAARDRFAEAEALGSPSRIARAREEAEAAEKAVDVAFRNFKASLCL